MNMEEFDELMKPAKVDNTKPDSVWLDTEDKYIKTLCEALTDLEATMPSTTTSKSPVEMLVEFFSTKFPHVYLTWSRGMKLASLFLPTFKADAVGEKQVGMVLDKLVGEGVYKAVKNSFKSKNGDAVTYTSWLKKSQTLEAVTPEETSWVCECLEIPQSMVILIEKSYMTDIAVKTAVEWLTNWGYATLKNGWIVMKKEPSMIQIVEFINKQPYLTKSKSTEGQAQKVALYKAAYSAEPKLTSNTPYIIFEDMFISEDGEKQPPAIPAPKAEKNYFDVIGITSNKDTVLKQWGLSRQFNLLQQAADFYTLYDISIDYPEYKIMLEGRCKWLCNQLGNYIDMVCGGELRHCSSRATGYKNVAHGDAEDKVAELIRLSGMKGLSRTAFWGAWWHIRKEYGLVALELGRNIFSNASWNGSYGGKRWGTIANTLLMYLKKETTQNMFIDTAFGLYHNGNIVYDKVWNVSGLKELLDYNQKGEIKKIVKEASMNIAYLWNDLHEEKNG